LRKDKKNKFAWQQQAQSTIVYQAAAEIRDSTQNRVSIETALLLVTEQPSLLRTAPVQLADRILQLAVALQLTPADAADLLVRNPDLINLLPHRLRTASESLGAALQLPPKAALVALAGDLNLLDTPPLRVREAVQHLAEALQLPFVAVTNMAVQQPSLLLMSPSTAKARFNNIINLLGIPSSTAVELLLQEPRLLLPKSDVVTSNHHQLQQLLGVTGEELSSWVVCAPELLLLSSDVVRKRLKLIPAILWQVSAKARAEHKLPPSAPQDWPRLVVYASRDPRVLLLNPHTVRQRALWLSKALTLPAEVVSWLVCCHPSYLVAEPGAVGRWRDDVQHLLQLSYKQVHKLLACPEVFLTVPVQHMLLVMNHLMVLLNLPFTTIQQLVSKEPLILAQDLPLLSASYQSLQPLWSNIGQSPGQSLVNQLLQQEPALLLLAPGRLQQVLQQQAAGLGLNPGARVSLHHPQ